MSITPGSPDQAARGKVRTWVTSQWKLRPSRVNSRWKSTLSFDYAITGDSPAWRPLRAFDDGRQTFIEFPASIATGEAPPLFVLDEKGEASLVNYRMSGRFYIVDRLFGAAELRLGAKKQSIVRITRVAGTSPSRRHRRGA